MSTTNLASRPTRSSLWARAGSVTGWRRWTALLLLVLIPLTVVGGILGASSARAEENESLQYSFYRVSSAMTAFFSSTQGPDVEDGKSLGTLENWSGVVTNPGSAGSFLGYADPSFSSVTGWLSSKLSGSSDAIGYDTLALRDEDDAVVDDSLQGLVGYAYYGASLKGLGFDGTSTGLSLGFMEMAGGFVVSAFYLLSGAVDWLFEAVINAMAFLNPFKLFYLGVQAVVPADVADGMVGGDTSVFGPLSGLASWISGWYQVLTQLSWAVMVPVFVAVLLMGLLLYKKMNRGSAIKKLLIRVAFIGLGLPLLGSMYTGTLTSMQAAADSGNAGATRVIMSTFVDFESWAKNSRLAVPEGATIEWDSSRDTPTNEAQMNVRNSALAINSRSLGLGLDPILTSDNAQTWTDAAVRGGADEYQYGSWTYGKAADMLLRYMGNAQFSASSFETESKGGLSKISADTLSNATKKGWFSSAESGDGKDKQFVKDGDLADMPADRINGNPVISLADGAGLTATRSGSAYEFSTASYCYGPGIVPTYGSDMGPRSCNLSPLAMYNYLNTDFGPTSMTMYSSSNVSSEATRSIHNSVNLVGSGAMSALYWTNAVVLLAAFVFIGFGYAISMALASIRRTFQMVSAVPFATLGALAAIAKVLVYTVALIAQVFLTVFLYKLVQEFLIALPQIIESPFAQLLNSNKAANGFMQYLVSGTGFSLVVTIVSIVFTIAFTVMAMRVRKSLVKAVEEAVTKLVEKLTETSVGAPGGGGGALAPALAGGLGAGAGAAMANRAMQNAAGKKGLAAGVPGSGKGPDGMGTAGGFTGGTDGGDSSTTVGGEIETGDGTLAVEGSGDAPAPGNGDPGSPLELTAGPSGDSAATETAEGKRVEVEGLSPDGRGYAVDANGDAVPAKPVQGDSDAMSDVSSSMEESAEGYKAADKQKLAAGTEGAQAVGHGAVAVGRGFAGDAAGAAESGGRAVEHGGQAVAAGERAKQAEQDAGRSSLDKPSTKHADRAQKAQQVSQVGGTVANAAGAASSTGGAGKAASQGAGAAKAPAKAPQAAQKGASAPKSTPTAPKQAPRPAAPQRASSTTNVSSTSVDRSSSVDRRSKVVNKSKKRIAPPKTGGKATKGLKPGSGSGKRS
ncbi:hypothetical protein [Leucobacter chromiireducens]|uniref:TrbL/VirB6 plasmid conjugal transfer protein n=1 Tax=Leucobacter chromiireducens subsp. chromiireducens TaxID=660067 RepID=A0ABS1SPI7_9MICO|nr:hypothetical protein [Leucobacter chromiireducens]MBL3689495.1 hypothetical protein [Leucobacter chromiireducens subsp. chromiireducens]